ncbi:MAG: response regulator transcription factor [Bacteroidetes bacterium]|nr:response regulator transcription factor [Bacteroidota bacterium]
MKKALKIGIVDDHLIFRKGLNCLINQIEDVEVVFEASNGMEFITFIEFEKVDIVFMDIQMPGLNGIEATKRAIKMNKGIKIIALSMYSDKDYFEEMIEAGASGFLLKDSVFEEIEEAIMAVKNNKNYFSEEIISFFTVKFVSDYLDKINKYEDLSTLNESELNSIKKICNSMQNQEITEAFYLTMVAKGMQKTRKKTYSLPAITNRRITNEWELQGCPVKFN